MKAFNPGPPFYSPVVTTTTTKKQNTFLSTPLQDSTLHDVPGVGPASHAQLTEAGVRSAQQLVGQFLVCDCDRDAMARWLADGVGLRVQEAGRIVDAVERKAKAMVTV
jgi:hypothetical protein